MFKHFISLPLYPGKLKILPCFKKSVPAKYYFFWYTRTLPKQHQNTTEINLYNTGTPWNAPEQA